jgi:hypothetical protein
VVMVWGGDLYRLVGRFEYNRDGGNFKPNSTEFCKM